MIRLRIARVASDNEALSPSVAQPEEALMIAYSSALCMQGSGRALDRRCTRIWTSRSRARVCQPSPTPRSGADARSTPRQRGSSPRA